MLIVLPSQQQQFRAVNEKNKKVTVMLLTCNEIKLAVDWVIAIITK